MSQLLQVWLFWLLLTSRQLRVPTGRIVQNYSIELYVQTNHWNPYSITEELRCLVDLKPLVSSPSGSTTGVLV